MRSSSSSSPVVMVPRLGMLIVPWISTIARPEGVWSSLGRGLFGLSSVEDEDEHADVVVDGGWIVIDGMVSILSLFPLLVWDFFSFFFFSFLFFSPFYLSLFCPIRVERYLYYYLLLYNFSRCEIKCCSERIDKDPSHVSRLRSKDVWLWMSWHSSLPFEMVLLFSPPPLCCSRDLGLSQTVLNSKRHLSSNIKKIPPHSPTSPSDPIYYLILQTNFSPLTPSLIVSMAF